MAYQTGNASDVGALLNLFTVFIGSLPGWIVRRNAVGTGNELRTAVVQRGGDEVWGMMARNDQWMAARLATGWDAGQPWNNQPGTHATDRFTGQNAAPVFGYNFFGSADYAYMVIEPTAGQYRHQHLGVLTKAGTYTGGAFLAATHVGTSISSSQHAWPWDDNGFIGSTTIVRAAPDGVPTYLASIANAAQTDRLLTSYRSNYHMAGLVSRGINLFAGNATLNPIRPAAGVAGGFFKPLGQVPDVRLVNMELAAPGETIPIGSDEWMVFPIVARAQTLAYPANSGMFGLAYRKTA